MSSESQHDMDIDPSPESVRRCYVRAVAYILLGEIGCAD
jgi:hypothetical protein